MVYCFSCQMHIEIDQNTANFIQIVQRIIKKWKYSQQMRKMKRAKNILSLWHLIFLFPCKIYFDKKKCFSLFLEQIKLK
jgi:hypothetical protein